MDRQDDRQTRRIDLYREKHDRLEQRVQALEAAQTRTIVELVKKLKQD